MINNAKNYISKLRKIILIALIALFMLSFIISTIDLVFAENFTEFDNTNLSEELESIEGFNWNNYPFDSTSDKTELEIFNVLEYRYSYHKENAGDYGVYVYIYNRSNKYIDRHSGNNTIMLANQFDDKGEPTNYDKYQLRYVSAINQGVHINKFFKFKVVNTAALPKLIDIVNRDKRMYCISEIELMLDNKPNASMLPIGATYTYTGFVDGLGTTEGNTLKWTVNELEFLEIKDEDFGHTSYVFKDNNEHGVGWHNQINSVYFSIPHKMLNKWGNLQKVKFSAYRYKTAPIFVTSDESIFANLNDFKYSTNLVDYNTKHTYVTNYGFPLNPYYKLYADIMYGYYSDFANCIPKKPITGSQGGFASTLRVQNLPYVFNRSFAVDQENNFSEVISSVELLNYMRGYSTVATNYLSNEIKLSKNLFRDIEGNHFIKSEIDAGATYSLTNIDYATGFWDKLFNKKPESIENFPLKPIEKVALNAYQDNLYVHANDVDTFKSKLSTATSKGRSMHMFRFALDDYYAAYVSEVHSLSETAARKDAFMALNTAYLNFDIITVTFSNEGKMKVIPVAMSPVDIVPGVTSPSEELPPSLGDIWAAIVKAVKTLGIIFLIVIIIVVIVYVIKLLLTLSNSGQSKVNLYMADTEDTSKVSKREQQNIDKTKTAIDTERKRLRKKE